MRVTSGRTTIGGVELEIGRDAVVVRSEPPLTVVSSAVVGGGFTSARTLVNLHVPKNFPCHDPDGTLAAFVRRRALPLPYVGLMTSAWTEQAEVATETADGLAVMAVVTVGLSNRITAGVSAKALAAASTINTIVVVDAAPAPAALVNLVMTATEVKTITLAQCGVRSADGGPITGTSTDAVVIGATGRGPACRFGGPVSELGWLVARAMKSALDTGIRRWLVENA